MSLPVPSSATRCFLPRLCRFASNSVNLRSTVHFLASEPVPGEPLVDDLRYCKAEPIRVVHVLTVVKPERLLIDVAEEMERFD